MKTTEKFLAQFSLAHDCFKIDCPSYILYAFNLQIEDLQRELDEFEEKRMNWEQQLAQESQSQGRNLQLESKQVSISLCCLAENN